MYVVYRDVEADFGGVLVYSGVVCEDGAQWFTYLAYWTLPVLTLNVVIQALLVLVWLPGRRKHVTQGNWHAHTYVSACTCVHPLSLHTSWVCSLVEMSFVSPDELSPSTLRRPGYRRYVRLCESQGIHLGHMPGFVNDACVCNLS